MKVKNLNNTSDKECKCSTWIEHWRNFTMQTATICRAKGCSNKNIGGSHVIKCDSTDKNHYIIPFCKAHNNSTECIEINDGTDLVSANKSKTCQ